MTETQITAAIVKHLKSLRDAGERVHWFKVAGGLRQRIGCPDLLVCFRGRCHAWEVKIPGQTATLRQAHEISLWRKAGAISEVVTSVEDVRRLLGL